MTNLAEFVPGIAFTLLRRSVAEPLSGWENAASTTSMRDALDQHPDMAILANPSAAHFKPLLELIAAGVPTYVEKPVVTSRAEVDAIRRYIAASPPAAHVTGYNLRLLPSLLRARDLIRGGALGSVVRANLEAGQWLPDWRVGQDHRLSYSANTGQGGGVIFDLSHELDAARYLLGEITLMGAVQANVPCLEIASEAVASMLGTSASGAIVSVTVDYVARAPIRRYTIVGDKGSLVWDLLARRLVLSVPGESSDIAMGADAFDVRETYRTAMAGFAAAAGGDGSAGLQDLEDGLRSADLAIAAHELSGAS